MYLNLFKWSNYKIKWFLKNKNTLKKKYPTVFFKLYFLLILYLIKKYKKFFIKKYKKKMSFHKFDSFNYDYFNLIKYKKLYQYNKKNKNKSIKGHKINYNKKSKKYKLISTNLNNNKYFYQLIYNIVNIQFNVYNYKIHILMCDNLGDMYFIPYSQNVNLFKFYMHNITTLNSIIDLQLPYLFSFLYKLKLSTIIFNLYKFCNNNYLNTKITYCRSLGSTAKIITHNKIKLLTYVKLPSNVYIYINSMLCCFISFNPIFKIEERRKIPKASIKHIKGYKSAVRGVAKNPIDHPHGGNTNSIKIKKNPWGKNN